MNNDDQERAARLFSILVGKPARGTVFTNLANASQNYEEFRVRVVMNSSVLPFAAPVAELWRARMKRTVTTPDANELMHTLESLSSRQSALEQKLRDRDAELLERLQQLDSLVTGLTDVQLESQQLRLLIGKYRDAIIRVGGERTTSISENDHAK